MFVSQNRKVVVGLRSTACYWMAVLMSVSLANLVHRTLVLLVSCEQKMGTEMKFTIATGSASTVYGIQIMCKWSQHVPMPQNITPKWSWLQLFSQLCFFFFICWFVSLV
jgi:hypothetical protein